MTLPADLYPFAALRLRTTTSDGAEVELRTGDLEGVVALAAVAAEGVHDEALMPFTTPWTRCEPAERARRTFDWQVGAWAGWRPEDWRLEFVVRRDGVVVGTQSLSARHFPVRREVGTGSWLGRAHQGRGTGRAMRVAVLALAFDHLGADTATSSAFVDNPASLAVSHGLGYADDGLEVEVREGARVLAQRLRLDRAAWRDGRDRGARVEVTGAGPALAALRPEGTAGG
ncbi:GNAT family N-acetyltransferase [Kineococcus gynurae]|uniref:GNAT family N-acetyltransferase n=1 Tax=Kineococcus gynurae TaxID=452979 RepID=A0ABV5LTF1_9ACTN